MARAPWAVGLLAVVLAAASPRAQAPQFPIYQPPKPQNAAPPRVSAPHGLILGLVVDAATGRGVPKAVVRLKGKGVAQTRLTDDRGRYYLSNLPAGDFTIDAIKSGYFDGAYGRLRAGGDATPITLLDGQAIGDANISLWRPAVLSGFLVDELNEPLVGVRVQALRRQFVDGRLRLVPAGADTTDDEGEYRIFDLLPGAYVISVPSSALTVPADELRELAASTSGVTTGLLALLIGSSAAPASIADAGGTYDPGGRTMTIGAQAALTPPPDAGRGRVYPTLYYPGTTLASMSTPIEIATAEVRTSVALQLWPVASAHVSGTVTGPDGPMSGQLLRLVPRGERDLGLGFETSLTISGADGRFVFARVPAGEYDLKAQNSLTALAPALPPGGDSGARTAGGASLSIDRAGSTSIATVTGGPLGGARGLWGQNAVTVADRDVDDVTVSMQTGFTLTARAVFDGSAPAPEADTLRRMRVTLQPIDTDRDAPRALVDESGAFVMQGIAPGRYVLAVDAAPEGWTLQDARANGRDISAAAIDVGDDVHGVTLAFTDHPATLSGAVRDSRGFAVPGAFAVIFPADDRDAIDAGVNPRRIRGTRTASSGVFTFGALPAGDYWLVGMTDAMSEGWQSPDALHALQKAATRVTVRAGASASKDVTIVTKPVR